MAALSTTDIFEFDRFQFDRRGLFRRDGNAALAPVELGSRALDVLRVLLDRPGDLVSRDEIMAAAWPGIVVEDNNLTIQIATLRRVLDQDRTNGSCIQTVTRRGYRFVAPVTRHEPATPAHVSSPSEGNGRSRDSRHARESGYPGQMSASVVLDPSPGSRPLQAVPGMRGGREDLMRSGLLIRPHVNLSNVAQGLSGRYRFWAGALAAAIGAVVLIATAGTWRVPWHLVSPAAPRLSIVVLPFANLGGDPEQQYFADGITEDLTTDLSRIVDMFVISRNTAFTYRNKPINTKQIGRELGVRYVLAGSVQRSGKKIRVTAQLIDSESDKHLWAEWFDRDTNDLFALQSEITSRLANALRAELIAAEAARPTDNPDALDYIFRGRAAALKPLSRLVYAEAISMYERALALDPQSVEAQSLLADALASRALDGVTDSAAADIARAEELATQALAASPRSPTAHIARAQVLRARGRCEEAIPEYETALAINRNAANVLNVLAGCKVSAGSMDGVIALEEQAIRLSPRDPRIGHFYFRIGHVHLLQSHVNEAIPWLEKARIAVPAQPFVNALLAAAYGLKGETERAAAELAEARRLRGDDAYSSIARLKAVAKARGYFREVDIPTYYEPTYFAGLRKAGMREE